MTGALTTTFSRKGRRKHTPDNQSLIFPRLLPAIAFG
jgi:hypothetical protein